MSISTAHEVAAIGAGNAGAAFGRARALQSLRALLHEHLPLFGRCQGAMWSNAARRGRCDSFSPWWVRASRGLGSAADLLAVDEVPAW